MNRFLFVTHSSNISFISPYIKSWCNKIECHKIAPLALFANY